MDPQYFNYFNPLSMGYVGYQPVPLQTIFSPYSETFSKVHPCSLLNEICQKLGIIEATYTSLPIEGGITINCAIPSLGIVGSAAGANAIKSQIKGLAATKVIEQLSAHANYAAAIQELLSRKLVSAQEPGTLRHKRKKPESAVSERSEPQTIESIITDNVNKIHTACQKLKSPCDFQEERCPNGMQKVTVIIERIVYGEGIDVNKKRAKHKATQAAIQLLCKKYGDDIILSKSTFL